MTTRLHLLRCLALVGTLLALGSGCASRAAFDTSFPPNRSRDLDGVLARIAGAPRPNQTPVVVGVSDAPRSLFAFDLAAQRLLFSTPSDVRGVPVAAGPFVVAPEGERLRVRELQTGQVVEDIDANGMHFVGADGDGSVTAVVLSSGGSYGSRSLLLLLRGRDVSKKLWVNTALGIPAVLGGVAFVPHSRVHLSAISPEGEELMRLTVRDDVASEALTDGRQVYFGLAGVYRLDNATPKGVKGGAAYFQPDVLQRRKLPGAPEFLRDTSEPPPPVDSAVHRIQLSYWPRSSSEGVGAANQALYLSFYRLVFALNEALDRAHWVRSTSSDIVGVGAHTGGLVVVEERGTVSAFDASGSAVLEAELGLRPIVASVRAEGLGLRAGGSPLPPLVEQLGAAILHDDTRLVPAGELAIRLMAALEDPEVTGTFVSICSSREAARRVRDSACAELAKRTQGGDSVLTALSQINDYLADTHTPPLVPLAKAAASAKQTQAAPLLLAHLEDPSTDADDLPALVRALGALEEPSVKDPLTRFVRLYHADAFQPGLEEALVAAVPLLTKLDAAGVSALLNSLLADPRTNPALRGAAQKQLNELAQAAEQKAATEAGAAPATAEAGAAAKGPPLRLGTEHLTQALAPLRPAIAQCLRNDPARPRQGRLTVVVDGATGKVTAVETLPTSLKGCVEPIVRGATFPITTQGKRETLHGPISQ
jgi:hypothetical protein